tara:strand:- start:935 stop:1288 length:354 start_codon:yes stop_codon:yes gene_type:complete
MSKKVTLPSGATATLKDHANLLVKDRKSVLKSTEVEGGDLSKSMALQDALIAMLIEEWSLELPIPSKDINSLGEMTPADFDFLIEETKDAQKALFPNLAETPENEADPKALTADSKD